MGWCDEAGRESLLGQRVGEIVVLGGGGESADCYMPQYNFEWRTL